MNGRRWSALAVLGLLVMAPAAAGARGLDVDVRTDRGDDAVYQPGDALEVRARASDDAYLLVYEIDAEGSVRLLYPYRGGSGFVEGRPPVVFFDHVLEGVGLGYTAADNAGGLAEPAQVGLSGDGHRLERKHRRVRGRARVASAATGPAARVSRAGFALASAAVDRLLSGSHAGPAAGNLGALLRVAGGGLLDTGARARAKRARPRARRTPSRCARSAPSGTGPSRSSASRRTAARSPRCAGRPVSAGRSATPTPSSAPGCSATAPT